MGCQRYGQWDLFCQIEGGSVYLYQKTFIDEINPGDGIIMNRIIYLPVFLSLLFFIGIISEVSVYGQSKYAPGDKDYTLFDVNTISAWITNYGSFFRNPITKNSGFEWPKDGSLYAIYAAGLWLGAKVRREVRVAVAEYSYEYLPGTIDGETHLPNDPNDSICRVYKITRSLENSWDYQHWPAEQGAPLDIKGQPLIMGDQTLWCVYNDADASQHVKIKSAPLGVEVQQTVFGWLRFSVRYSEYNDLIFIRWLLVNKGVDYLDSMYVTIWSDPDLGDSGDDFVGCDSLNSLVYCYNSSDFDGEYGEHPPAVGFQILQGPILSSPGDTAVYLGRKIANYKNLPMTSFVRYMKKTDWLYGFPQTAQDIYYFMQARWKDGRKIVNDGHMGTGVGPETNYMFSGDPEKGTGWLDFAIHDRRFVMSSGPFNLAQGDSQEVVIATIIARGNSHLNSVTKLKTVAKVFRQYYNSELYKILQSYSLETVHPVIKELGMFQNYPNPFNSQTILRYRLPIARTVRLEIFNSSGQKVATLINEHQEPDEYEVVWDASGMASGIYFAHLRVAQYDFTKKLLLLK
jgi:hypothetical protein